jgi:hypothetical protein
MASSKHANAFDQSVFQIATEFNKIPNYQKSMEDPELRSLHSFVAIGMAGIVESRNLVAASFVPATNKAIAQTRQKLRKSIYAGMLGNLDENLEDLRDETVRLGYVFTFHKFESFVKHLMKLLDERPDTKTGVSIEKYAEKEFGFNPYQWFKCPSVHLVNFISNCTKHQDGYCRLDNPKYTIPDEFTSHSADEKIKRTVKEYQTDVQKLIDKITPLIQVITSIYQFRTAVHLMSNELFDDEIGANARIQLDLLKVPILKSIADYCS